MQYAEYTLTDLGYADGQGKPLTDIEDRDNRDEPFHHLGYSGYPADMTMAFDRTDKSKCLALFADGATLPPGGTTIQTANVVVLLVAEYGWPVGTTLVDGLPVAPERGLTSPHELYHSLC